jgi:hypothetical protein
MAMRRNALGTGAALIVAAAAARGEILSDDLANETTDVESASGARWLAASFGTGSNQDGYQLASVTLLLGGAVADPAEVVVDVYDDGGLEPGAWLATLAPAGAIPVNVAEATFTASDLVLAPDATHWLVVSAPDVAVEWGWSSDSSGTGDGFQYTWGASDDAGASWFSWAIYPTQMRVVATPVPEPDARTAALGALLAVAAVRAAREEPVRWS